MMNTSKTIIHTKIDNIQSNKLKVLLNKLNSELIASSENSAMKKKIYFIPNGFVEQYIKYHYIIFEIDYLTTNTTNIDLYYTNDEEFINSYIK